MDSNKHEPIKPQNQPEEILTDAETAQLRALLREVYPEPKHSIKDSVMAQIHAEAEAAKKSQRVAARRKRQALFMKWGGMAACVTILCGALVIASPMLSKSGYTASGEAAPEAAMAMDMDAPTEALAYADVETRPETASTENGTTIMRSMLMSTALSDEAKAEAEAADAADVIQETEATVAQTTAAPVEEKSAVVAVAEEAANLCDGLPTKENMPAATAEKREAFLHWLTDNGYLTADQYQAWLTDKGYTGPADWQATELCEAFGLDTALIEAWSKES